MKQIHFLLLATFLFCNGLMAQSCLPNGTTFSTQQDIDNFAMNYPSCTVITGEVTISSNAINSLSGLNQLTSIGGSLTISDCLNLNNLQGLQNITSIGGSLTILQCTNLLSLEGLQNITSISDSLKISNSPQLTDLQELQNINSLGGSLTIQACDLLASLQGLQNINSIGGSLSIGGSSQLTSLQGLQNITSIDGSLAIGNYDLLTSLQGLQNINSIGGSLTIQACDLLSSLQGLQNINSIGGNLTIQACDLLSSLQGLQNINSIGGSLKIFNCPQLTGLQELQNINSISENLIINDCDLLTSLQGLQNINFIGGSLTLLSCNLLTNLQELQNINSVGGSLTVFSFPQLTSLQGLQNINFIGGSLKIFNCPQLTNFQEFQNITNVPGDLDISICNGITDLTGLENITSVGGNFKLFANVILSDITALDNLTNIIGPEINITYNNSLTNLIGLDNANIDGVTLLEIYQNPSLSFCGLTNICNYLTNSLAYQINDNAPDCNTDFEVLNTCANLSKIQASTYYDINQNKIQDNGEPNFNDAAILIEPGALVMYPNTQNGSIFFIEPGSYSASYDLTDPNWELTTDSTFYSLSVGTNETDTIYFGVHPIQQISNQISFTNSAPARCNETVAFNVTTKNIGTTITNGTMWFAIDSSATSVIFTDTPDTLIAPNLYGWYFNNLYPSQTITKYINIGIPGPPDIPVGGILNFDSYVEYTDANGNHTSLPFGYNPEVQCSYDPNDKLVYPDRTDDFMENYTLFDESLFYTVRFQNTGNAVAYDVVIKDTLDANLDWTTFQFLNSSHADVLTTIMDEDGILTFDFQNIFLPDSTSNFEGSQGYVTYLIQGNPGLAENTIIENSAGIYFDLNPPVITNTTENVMVSVLPTISTTNPETLPEVSIFPNPNTGLFEVTGIAEGDYSILNTAGQIVQRGQLSNGLSIDISAAPQGVYFMSITIGEQVLVKRIVKM